MTGLAPAIAAHGLPTRHVLPAEPLTDAGFGDLVQTCERERLLGLLGFAVGSDAFPVAGDQRARVEENVAAWSAHALRVERMLLRVLDVLAAVDIPSRVLKGVALAHTVYARPELRTFGDLDLLIPSAEVDRAVEVLRAELDADRPQPELRPGFDRRFGKEVLLRVDDTLELDLHRVFVDGAFGLTIELDHLFAPPYRFPLAGYELEALPMPQRLLHACYAAALGDWPPRLMSLRDVVELVLVEQPNLVDVLLMARAWRCEVVVARAVTTAWRELAVVPRPPLVDWAARYQPTRLDRVLLAAHEGVARAFTRHLAASLVLSSAGERVAYLRAIALPQTAYLKARGLTPSDHVTRAWRAVRG